MGKNVWMRVTDKGSPLCGWDLLVEEGFDVAAVHAARRLDILCGDRPFQFHPPDGLGILVLTDRLELSPVQDEIVEISSDSQGLYGDHIETREYEHTAEDDTRTKLTVEVFTDAVQVAMEHKDLLLSKTWFGDPDDVLLLRLEEMMEHGDVDALIECIDGGNDGRAQA